MHIYRDKNNYPCSRQERLLAKRGYSPREATLLLKTALPIQPLLVCVVLFSRIKAEWDLAAVPSAVQSAGHCIVSQASRIFRVRMRSREGGGEGIIRLVTIAWFSFRLREFVAVQ